MTLPQKETPEVLFTAENLTKKLFSGDISFNEFIFNIKYYLCLTGYADEEILKDVLEKLHEDGRAGDIKLILTAINMYDDEEDGKEDYYEYDDDEDL